MSEHSVSDELRTGSYWATDLPLLRVSMLLPRGSVPSDAFPFSNPTIQYVHFARNAIYALARHFGLAGADVLVPAYFHGVEIEALVAAGVRPRFFPVRSGMRVHAEDIVRCIRPETRAVYLIHYLGFPGPIEDLQGICRERGLLLFEDCALALLSSLGPRPLGSFGDASVFCLYKTLPTVDGGAVVLRDGSLKIDGTAPPASGTAREVAVSLLRSFQRRQGAVGRGLIGTLKKAGKLLAKPAKENWVPVGTQDFNPGDANLLMSSVSRAVVAAQNFERIVSTRRRNFLHLQSLLSDLAPTVFDRLPDGVCPLFYPFVTARKIELWRQLESKGVQAVLFWLPRQFAPARGDFPEVDQLRETVLELPCHQDMSPADIERLAQVVRTSLRQIGR